MILKLFASFITISSIILFLIMAVFGVFTLEKLLLIYFLCIVLMFLSAKFFILSFFRAKLAASSSDSVKNLRNLVKRFNYRDSYVYITSTDPWAYYHFYPLVGNPIIILGSKTASSMEMNELRSLLLYHLIKVKKGNFKIISAIFTLWFPISFIMLKVKKIKFFPLRAVIWFFIQPVLIIRDCCFGSDLKRELEMLSIIDSFTEYKNGFHSVYYKYKKEGDSKSDLDILSIIEPGFSDGLKIS